MPNLLTHPEDLSPIDDAPTPESTILHLPWMHRRGERPADNSEYFALLTRTVMSQGLGPRVVEARWAGIATAFYHFDITKVAAMSDGDVMRLLSDPGVIRNRRKIEATITNAQICERLIAAKGDIQTAIEAPVVFKTITPAVWDWWVDIVARTFPSLAATSAALFLFSCGYRAVQE